MLDQVTIDQVLAVVMTSKLLLEFNPKSITSSF